jgi:hypothetical protein
MHALIQFLEDLWMQKVGWVSRSGSKGYIADFVFRVRAVPEILPDQFSP